MLYDCMSVLIVFGHLNTVLRGTSFQMLIFFSGILFFSVFLCLERHLIINVAMVTFTIFIFFTKLELNYNHLPVYIHCVHVCYVYTGLYGIYEPAAWKILVAELRGLYHRCRPMKHVIHVCYKIHTSRSKPYKQDISI